MEKEMKYIHHINFYCSLSAGYNHSNFKSDNPIPTDSEITQCMKEFLIDNEIIKKGETVTFSYGFHNLTTLLNE